MVRWTKIEMFGHNAQRYRGTLKQSLKHGGGSIICKGCKAEVDEITEP